jgi:cell division protease FtsH
MNRKTAFNVLYVVVALLAFLIIQDFYQSATRYRTIPYSRFEQLLNGNKIDKVWVEQNSISGTLKVKEKDGLQRFITTRVNSDLAAKLDQHHVTFFGEAPTNWLSDILSWVVPALLFFVVWTFVMRRFGQQGFGGTVMSIGKSRAKIYVEKDTKVTFDDVAGVDEAKDELKEIVEFLKNPKTYGRLGARVPKGCSWSGPRAPARPCWRARSQARQASSSFRYPAPNSSRCLWASAQRGCATCSSRRARKRRQSSS